jgi:hypothetical protein
MIAEECLAIGNVFKEARKLAWASETPLLEEFSHLMADMLNQLSPEFDRDAFLKVANGEGIKMGFWNVIWKHPETGVVTRQLVLRQTAGQAMVWLLDRHPWLLPHLADGCVKIEPYKALSYRTGEGRGVL